MEAIIPKFQLGDRVTSKQTGLPAVGRVVCIYDPMYFVGCTEDPRRFIVAWSEFYPDWMSKPVVCIKLDQPQRQSSFQEYKSGWQGDPPELFIRAKYESMPAVPFITYPEDDLELL